MRHFIVASLALSACTVNVMRPEIDTSKLTSLSVRELCAAYAPSRNAQIKSELVRRNAFSAEEWDRVERGQRRPDGMREQVLWCAWGLPGDYGEIVTTTSGATRYRYAQQELDFDIIVTDGVVTDWNIR